MSSWLVSWAKPQYVARPRQIFLRMARALRRPSSQEIVQLPWGADLIVDPSETIGKALWHLGVFDLAVTEAIWRLVRPGEKAIDIGANIGYTTGLMACRAGPSGRVLAFEPHPTLFERLQANIALARRNPSLAEVLAFAAAVGARKGTARLAPGAGYATNHGMARLIEESDEPSFEVAVTTLDEVIGDSEIDVVKIDVEGAEERVLEGAAHALARHRVRHLIFESNPVALSSFSRRLSDCGYEVCGLGMTRSGLVLTPPGSNPQLPPYESPNYLATLEPDLARRALCGGGWHALRSAKLDAPLSARIQRP